MWQTQLPLLEELKAVLLYAPSLFTTKADYLLAEDVSGLKKFDVILTKSSHNKLVEVLCLKTNGFKMPLQGFHVNIFQALQSVTKHQQQYIIHAFLRGLQPCASFVL